MFEREHHRRIALVLQALEPAALEQRRCYFGGGTAMALLHGEYRESVDIDFLVADREGYRDLRQLLGGLAGLGPITRPGMQLALAREVRADQYGVRTQVRSGDALVKFEIVFEARVDLASPSEHDRICGVQTLTAGDLACEKLLANADRWRDDSVFNRDLIDLAMQALPKDQLQSARLKAEAAYGRSIPDSVQAAVQQLQDRPGRLAECMQALRIGTVSRAQLWQAIRRIGRQLAPAA